VVVAEDSPTEAACLEFLLSKNGYAVVIAQDGEEALQVVRANPPDILVSDVVMPKLDGYVLCEAVKADAATARVPVVLLTGLVDPDARSRGMESGADAFLLKPYDEKALLAQIGVLLARGDSRT
jgi:DNA-binding response OmpR family regulator